jgi:hypothetical protein
VRDLSEELLSVYSRLSETFLLVKIIKISGGCERRKLEDL